MVACIFFVCLLASIPLALTFARPLHFAPSHPLDIFCKLPIIKHKHLCVRQGSSTPTVYTPLGTAKGTVDVPGANRFVVKYASAKRWAESSVATVWELPNISTNVTTLPLACPQQGVDNSLVSEDCLSMILYVPQNLERCSVPTMVWIHGGSFRFGSATGPGLNGSKLAVATNSIVAVIQYRLGALGFMPPDGNTNLAVKDVINALKFLKKVVPSFGGDSAAITVAGQSSGATLIRSLLAVPSASSLFRSAIIQSDPMNFGMLKPSIQKLLQNAFTSSLNCSSTDTACLNALPIDTIISAQESLSSTATDIDPSVGMAIPIRPVHDGALITSTLDSTFPFPLVSKPLLISTVADEAGPTIFGSFTTPVSESFYEAFVNGTFGATRATTILGSSLYKLPAPSDAMVFDGRDGLQRLGTDYMWKCSSWSFARNWVQHGGRAFVGLYTIGATYPDSEGIPFCVQSGSVCHESDIEIVFGTVPNPASAQTALTLQIQKRYKAFLSSGNPNTPMLSPWTAATTSDVHAIDLGGTGQAPVGACEPSFWGQAVPFDFQVFGL